MENHIICLFFSPKFIQFFVLIPLLKLNHLSCLLTMGLALISSVYPYVPGMTSTFLNNKDLEQKIHNIPGLH